MTKTDLLDMVERATGKPVRMNAAAIQRLISILDLAPNIPADGIKRAVADELADQRRRALEALAPLGGERGAARAAALLDEAADHVPRDALADVAAGAAEPVAAALAVVVERSDRFRERLGWLLAPTPPDEIEQLDPKRDANRIYHHVTWDFRVEQKLYAVLFETRPVMHPMAAMFFASTGEFTVRAFKRINDTVVFFSNMIEWGIDSKRGRAAVERVNGIHGRYSIPSDAFRFILGGLMFCPDIWNKKLGWRPFTDVERLGYFHNFIQMGRAMNIQGLSDSWDEERAWWWDVSTRICRPNAAGKNVFVEIALQVLATYPAELRRPIVGALLAGMDDAFRENLGFPEPPADFVDEARAVFRLLAKTMRATPRVPWLRSLQLYPAYWDLDGVGVQERSRFMPAPANGARFAEQQRPALVPNEVAEPALPVVTEDDVARHATPSSPWIIIDGYVYDLTRFLYEHPGGARMLLPWLGKDATLAFRRVPHSNNALIMLANFRIAKLAGAPPTPLLPAPRDESAVKPARPSAAERAAAAMATSAERREAWEATLDLVCTLTAQYELANRQRDVDPKDFPIDLPTSPRSAANAGGSAAAAGAAPIAASAELAAVSSPAPPSATAAPSAPAAAALPPAPAPLSIEMNADPSKGVTP